MDKKIKIGELDARTMLYTELKTAGGDPSLLFEILRGIIDRREWERLLDENGNPVGTLRNLIEEPLPTGVGQSVEKIRALLKVEHKHGSKHEWLEKLRGDFEDALIGVLPKHGEVGNGRVSDTNSTEREPDNEYIISRLKRDNPALAQSVIRGEVTANQAAIQTGIRREYIRVRTDDMQKVVEKLASEFSRDDLRAIKDGISELLGE